MPAPYPPNPYDAGMEGLAELLASARRDPRFKWLERPQEQVVGDAVRASDSTSMYDPVMGGLASALPFHPVGAFATVAAPIVVRPGWESVRQALTALGDPANAVVPAAVKSMRRPQIAAAQETLAARPRTPTDILHSLVSSRDELYHATDPNILESIFQTGAILPNELLHQGFGTKAQMANMAQKALKPMESVGTHLPNASKPPKLHKTSEYLAAEEELALAKKLWLDVEETGLNDQETNKLFKVYAGKNKVLEDLKTKLIGSDSVNPDAGVSVSRVPRIASKDSKAVSLVLDPAKIGGPRRPLAEPDYQKTVPTETDYWYNALTKEEKTAHQQLAYITDVLHPKKYEHQPPQVYLEALDSLKNISKSSLLYSKYLLPSEATPLENYQAANTVLTNLEIAARERAKYQVSKPNRHFEFEDRTFGTPIPTRAVKELWVDKQALRGHEVQTAEQLRNLETIANINNIPMRVFESGRSMHSARAARARDLQDLLEQQRQSRLEPPGSEGVINQDKGVIDMLTSWLDGVWGPKAK